MKLWVYKFGKPTIALLFVMGVADNKKQRLLESLKVPYYEKKRKIFIVDFMNMVQNKSCYNLVACYLCSSKTLAKQWAHPFH